MKKLWSLFYSFFLCFLWKAAAFIQSSGCWSDTAVWHDIWTFPWMFVNFKVGRKGFNIHRNARRNTLKRKILFFYYLLKVDFQERKAAQIWQQSGCIRHTGPLPATSALIFGTHYFSVFFSFLKISVNLFLNFKNISTITGIILISFFTWPRDSSAARLHFLLNVLFTFFQQEHNWIISLGSPFLSALSGQFMRYTGPGTTVLL